MADNLSINTLQLSDLRKTLVVNGFNDLCIGDLAFLAMLIGMSNSDGEYCLLCDKIASPFNCTENKVEPRSRELGCAATSPDLLLLEM